MRFRLLCLLLAPLSLFARPGYYAPWGKESDLCTSQEKPLPADPPTKMSFAVRLAEMAILFHQNVLTHANGPRSNFRPTSSRYMLLAIRRHGFLEGFCMGCDRLLRENEDRWVYRTIEIDGRTYKWDPPP